MSRFEYILPFVSIIIGLSIADLLTSLHRLLRARARVRWHALPLLAAALVMFGLTHAWWTFFYVGQDESLNLGNLFRFLIYLPHPALLFLMAAAVLPDVVPATGCDLLQHYFNEQRYFYGLVVLYVVHIIAMNLINRTLGVSSMAINVGILALTLLLAFNKNVKVHAALLAGIAALAVATVVQFSLVVG